MSAGTDASEGSVGRNRGRQYASLFPQAEVKKLREAVEENRFGDAGKLLFESQALRRLPHDEFMRIHSSVAERVRERAKAILTDGEATQKKGEQFVECVSWFHEELAGKLALPHELSPEITEAITDHLVTTFKDHDPDEIGDELAKFQKLALLTEEIGKETPELKTAMAEKLLKYFEEQDSQEECVKLMLAYQTLTKREFQPDSETRDKLNSLAFAWLEEDFTNWEQLTKEPSYEVVAAQDPRKPLVLLSLFIDDLHCVTAAQVRRQPKLLHLVRKALKAAESYPDIGEPPSPEVLEGLNSMYRQFSVHFFRGFRWPFRR